MTTEELIAELKERAVVEIHMTENGVEFINADNQVIFVIPFAGMEG